MRRWREIVGAALFAVVATLALVAVVALAITRSAPIPPAKRPDSGENARREHRPQFGPDESQPIQHTRTGKMREELIAELGEPTREGPWQIGFPKSEVFEMYKGLRTLEWHWESGKFLASVYPENGRCVCFNSVWVPKSVIID